MKNKKEKELEHAIKLTWSSLNSHLQWTYKKSSEGAAFHKKCVKDYAKIITTLANRL